MANKVTVKELILCQIIKTYQIMFYQNLVPISIQDFYCFQEDVIKNIINLTQE